MSDANHDPNLFDTLQDISDAVSEATRTGDYSHLSSSIQNSAADLADSIGNSAQRGAQNIADAIRGGGAGENAAGNRSGSAQSAADGSYRSAYEGQGEQRPGERGAGKTSSDFSSHAAHANNSSGADADGYPFGKDTATWRKQEEIHREKQSRAWGSDPGKTYFLQTTPNRLRGGGKRIFGMLGALACGFYCVIDLIAMGMSFGSGSVGAGIAALVLAAATGAGTWGFARMFHKGQQQKMLIDEYYRYAHIVGGNEYFYLDDIARRTSESRQEVAGHLLEMQKQGLLPDMALDQQKTTLMLTQDAWRQYQIAEESRREREQSGSRQNGGPDATAGRYREENSQADRQPGAEDGFAGNSGGRENADARGAKASGTSSEKGQQFSPEVTQLLREGNDYIREIRAINDRIPDTEEMSNKLYRLEDIMQRIFAQVEKEPSKAKDLRKLMNYYLPTTTKLLRAYAELPDSPDSGENIRTTRQQIEDSMDSINDAFEKLLDDLFQDEAWDLSSDLNVMKTMMQQDGLMEDKKAEGK